MKPEITKEYLNSIFEYKDGFVYWKENNKQGNKKMVVPVGYLDSKGYYAICINDIAYRSHRIIWMMHFGEIPKVIDHINGIKIDNRIENLRLATQAQNTGNCYKSKNNTSGFKGVSPLKGKWTAQITKNRKKHHLGCFETKEAAYEKYKEAAKEYFGEFAKF